MSEDTPTPAPRQVHVAGTAWRALAFGIDLIPLGTVWLLVTLSVVGDAAELPPEPVNLLDRIVDLMNARPDLFVWPAAILALGLLLWPLPFWLLGRRTPGERLCGLTVTGPETGRLTPWRTLAWSVGRVLGLAVLLVGPLWALIDADRRTLYDRAAGVWILRAPVKPAASV